MLRGLKQVKFTIEAGIVSAFKARCEEEGISMTAAIRQFMESGQLTKAPQLKMSTRPQRRKAVKEVISLLNDILWFEEEYGANIPEQFEQRIEVSDHSSEQLAEAITCLEEAF
jgi:hypothetical protein